MRSVRAGHGTLAFRVPGYFDAAALRFDCVFGAWLQCPFDKMADQAVLNKLVYSEALPSSLTLRFESRGSGLVNTLGVFKGQPRVRRPLPHRMHLTHAMCVTHASSRVSRGCAGPRVVVG